MATRIPLVINAGQIEQLQLGDTLVAPINSPDVYSVTNGESSTALVIGMAVYNTGTAATVKRAQANAISTAEVVGLMYSASTAASASGQMVSAGLLTATVTQWDAVITGGSTGLSPGGIYYLDPTTPGFITLTAPTTTGQVVTQIGVAMNTTDMLVNVQKTILL